MPKSKRSSLKKSSIDQAGSLRGRIRRSIFAQIQHFGLTTIPAVVWATGATRDAARFQFQRLLVSGKLSKHTLATALGPFTYFQIQRNPFRERHVRDRFAALWLSLRYELPYKYLTAAQLTGLATISGLPETCTLPRSAQTCRVGNDRRGKIGLLRLHYQPDEAKVNLNTVVAAIDHMVCEPSFALWHWLAMAQRFTLMYLIAGETNAAELGRWLRRRPPVARALAPPTPIDVRTYVAEHLRPTDP